MLEGTTDESRKWREQKDEFWSGETNEHIILRLAPKCLALIVCVMVSIHGIWPIVKQQILQNLQSTFCNSDVRFENEAIMIRQVGGEVWRICRGTDPRLVYFLYTR